MELKINIIAIGIHTETSIGSFSVLPKTAEKSLKKKINILDIMVKNTYVQLFSLNLVPRVKKELNNNILSRKKGNENDLCNFACISLVE